MTGPFIVKALSTIHPGAAEAYAPLVQEICQLVEENEPRVLGFHIFADEDRTSEVVVQIHPDSASLQFHLQVLGEKVRESFDYTDFVSLEIYGTPDQATVEWIERLRDRVPVTVYPVHMGGFMRVQDN